MEGVVEEAGQRTMFTMDSKGGSQFLPQESHV